MESNLHARWCNYLWLNWTGSSGLVCALVWSYTLYAEWAPLLWQFDIYWALSVLDIINWPQIDKSHGKFLFILIYTKSEGGCILNVSKYNLTGGNNKVVGLCCVEKWIMHITNSNQLVGFWPGAYGESPIIV